MTKLVSALLFFSIGWSSLSEAQVFNGATSSAMGGAGRAAVDPSESVLLNPAVVPHIQGYFVSGQYAMGWHPVDGNSRTYAAMISDGTPENIIEGAFTYVNRSRTLPSGGTIKEQDLQLALAGFVFDRMTLGIAGHRLTWEQHGLVGFNRDYGQTNMNVGLLYAPNEWLGLALTGYDVLPADQKIPVGVRVVPTVAVGSHILVRDMFRLRLDLVRPEADNPQRRVNVMAGLESYFLEKVAFRLGAQWRETADQTLVATGIGFKGPRLSFDYTFERDVRTAEGSRHLFDLWLPF